MTNLDMLMQPCYDKFVVAQVQLREVCKNERLCIKRLS